MIGKACETGIDDRGLRLGRHPLRQISRLSAAFPMLLASVPSTLPSKSRGLGRTGAVICGHGPSRYSLPMCNLYSMARSRDEVRRLFRVGQDRTANQPPLPAIFPVQLAPVVHIDRDGARAMEAMRWGFPPPPNLGNRPVTNVRNVASPYWRGWLKPEWCQSARKRDPRSACKRHPFEWWSGCAALWPGAVGGGAESSAA